MFKYTKRLISNIRFYWNEFKLELHEDDELDAIEMRHKAPMAGFEHSQQKKKERELRIQEHEKELAEIK
ncbi:MAG: hypothetical protein IJ776_05190 [Paludibacteraceae bacterium]|nr:hypothetical protein [Paludibacteraceae bacterium]